MALTPDSFDGINGDIQIGSGKRIAIIGAGVSGILSIKACKEEDKFFAEIICYEKTSHVGGLWRYRELPNEFNNNQNKSNEDVPTVMEGTIANSSKEMSAFSDFPPDPKTPNYMHHKVMLKYIESYALHFDCIKHIKFNHEVEEISQINGKWKICFIDHTKTSTHKSEFFDMVMICTGHHGRPFEPNIIGQHSFKGKQFFLMRCLLLPHYERMSRHLKNNHEWVRFRNNILVPFHRKQCFLTASEIIN